MQGETFRNRMLDLFYPPHCPVCQRIPKEGLICAECERTLRYIDENYCLKCGKLLTDPRQEYCDDCIRKRHFFEEGRSLLVYEGPVRPSLYRLKYADRKEYARFYGDRMAQHLGDWIRRRGITRIVPVPLHPKKRRERGYNQAEELAKRLGYRMDLPVDTSLLIRCKNTVPQKNLTDRERMENLRGAFRATKDAGPQERILLLDDIYTTGATLDSASAALSRRGLSKVYCITVASGG